MNSGKVKILHVDDDEANRYAVTRSLRRAGFDVTEAATGGDALRQVQQKPDLIILDVRLPDIDGFEVCRRIKSDPATAQIPVLHLSASRVTSEDKAFGLNGGAEGYLVRPVEPVELVATIHALLRARQSEAKLQEREQQFKALLEGVQEYAIFAIDTRGTIVSWHAGAERMMGYTAAEAIGMSYERLFPDEELHANTPERERAAAAEIGECQIDGVRLRKDGTRFDAAVVLTATRTATGELIGYLKMVQDVSLRKQAEAAREAQLASEQAARIEAERVGG
ncbi:MAG: response regulator [Tepidisphaeraceae bacterium]